MTLTPTSTPDWSTAAGLPAPWAAIWPAPSASFADATALVWEAVDPALADLCRSRVAMLLGNPAPAPRAGLGAAHDAKVAELSQWPTSPRFTSTDRACLAFTEQFVMDVGSMTPELVAPVADALGEGTAAFVQALFLLDMDVRMAIVLPRLFGVPAPLGEATGAGDGGRAADGAGPADGSSVDLWASIEARSSTSVCSSPCTTRSPVCSSIHTAGQSLDWLSGSFAINRMDTMHLTSGGYALLRAD